MAIRFDAAADRLTYGTEDSTGRFPALSDGFTLTAWVRIDVDKNDWTTPFRMSRGLGTLATLGFGSAGTDGPGYYTASGNSVVSGDAQTTVPTWVCVAFTRAGATPVNSAAAGGVIAWRKKDGTGTTQAGAISNQGQAAQNTQPDTLCIGGRDRATTDEWFTGSVMFVRVWSAELTQTEIEAEWASPIPVKTSGLHSNWPLANPSTLASLTGTSRPLVTQSGGTPESTDGPLGAWGSTGPQLVFSSFKSANNGSGLTSDTFTPANGDLIVVKGGTWSSGTHAGTPSGGGLIYNSQVTETGGGFNGYAQIWSVVVSGSPGAMAVAQSAPGASSHHMQAVEVWRPRSGETASIGAVDSYGATTGGNVSGSNYQITTTVANSAVSWMVYDNNSVAATARQYSPDALETGFTDPGGSSGIFYSACQKAPTATAVQTGLSAPTSMRPTWAAVEIKSTSGPSPIAAVIAGALPNLAGTIAATVRADGLVAGSLPNLGGTIAAGVINPSLVAGALPNLGGVIAATVRADGLVAGSLPGLGGSLAADVRTSGLLGGVLPSLGGSLSMDTVNQGALAGVLPTLGGSLAGTVKNLAALAGALPGLAGALTAETVNQGAFAGQLPGLAGALAALVRNPGLLGGELPSLGGVLIESGGVLAFASPMELYVNRLNTRAFILADPVVVALKTRTPVRTPSGAVRYDNAAIRPSQVFKLIMQSPAGSSIEQRTEDGTERQIDFILLGEWDADITVGDWWEAGATIFEVKALVPTNGYETRAVVEAHGKELEGG